MFKNIKLRTKMLIVGSIMTILPLAAVTVIVYILNVNEVKVATKESIKLATNELDHIAAGVYKMCETQNDALLQALESYLNVARDTVNNLGGITFARESIIWNAVNQYNKATVRAQLPKMLVGNTWFGKTTDFKSRVPVVDHVKDLAPHVTCTVFQRMNNTGDMLRIATNVENTDGTRAVGTYIPKINPDGTESHVISTVLKGQAYHGHAYVVHKWYLTAYEPIYGENNDIIGALYVGIPQESIKSLRNAIMNIKIGDTGYLSIMDSNGHYVISKDGKRDGEDISDLRDSDGNLFVMEMINKALPLKPGEFAEHHYHWKNPGDPKAREKFARIMYFEPWDWVINAGSYKDEFLKSATDIKNMSDKSHALLFIVIAISLAVSSLIWLLVSNTITKPIVSIVNAINKVSKTHDLTIEVPVGGRDEIGIMAREFNNLLKFLQDSIILFSKVAKNVEGFAMDVNQRAIANQQRAQEQEEKMNQTREIVTQMKETAGEVAMTSDKQKEAASESNKVIEGLVPEMKNVSESSSSQVNEANSANERVEAMGETGSKVVAVAQNQDQQIKEVTEAVDNMKHSMKDLSEATSRAMEFANSALQAVGEGKDSVEATVDGMRAISESSDQISEIITVITEISEQTNLLSLNAAIEAARAGSHGKGFAVVADAVGKLAQRSSEAAKEITQLIKDSGERVAEGAKLSDQSRKALEKIAEGGSINSKAVEEISRATDILAEGTRNVDELMKILNQEAEEIANMAGQQGERRSAAQEALNALTEKASKIFESIDGASSEIAKINERMSIVANLSDKIEDMTSMQAERSKTLTEIVSESAQSSAQTVKGTGEVANITKELQKLSTDMTRQISQFKVIEREDTVESVEFSENPS
jgi:methyl-accepting chemotaxis protein